MLVNKNKKDARAQDRPRPAYYWSRYSSHPARPRVRIFIVVQLLWIEGSRMGVARTVGARAVAGGGRDGRAFIMATIFHQRKIVASAGVGVAVAVG